jgi:para-nitrobenzyl esterase
VRTRWINFAVRANPEGPPGEPGWEPYRAGDRACLIIDKRDSVVRDVDADIRAAWGSEMVSFR